MDLCQGFSLLTLALLSFSIIALFVFVSMWIVIITVTMDFPVQGFFHDDFLLSAYVISPSVYLSTDLSHTSVR